MSDPRLWRAKDRRLAHLGRPSLSLPEQMDGVIESLALIESNGIITHCYSFVNALQPQKNCIREDLLPQPCAEGLCQRRHDLEQVADDAVLGDVEDRCVFVLVDGDDDLGIGHAGQVLDGARDAARHV